MLSRRDTLVGAAALLATGAVRPPSALAAIEAGLNGGRLGVAAVDLASGRRLAHRAGERFPLCSTFKLPLAAAILMAAEAGRLSLDRTIAVTRADIVPHAPVVEPALATGSIAVRDLVRAILTESDNAAANLLLPLVGGPAGFTRFLRAQGDPVSRLDHPEPGLNIDVRAGAADTTSPAAMLASSERLLTGAAIGAESRAALIGWMAQNARGATRLRAGLPAGWRAGDRTGTADGQTNDIAIAWAPGARRPLLAACYIDAPQVSADAREAVQAAVGRIAARLVRGPASR